ncbi:hypothetical protein YC2023_036874 [Brassica napus]
MLRNPSSVLKSCAAFALLQFTLSGGRHAIHHASLMQNGGEARVLRSAADFLRDSATFSHTVTSSDQGKIYGFPFQTLLEKRKSDSRNLEDLSLQVY